MTDDGENSPLDEFNVDSLERLREETSTTLDWLVEKNSQHQKKAMQMLQLNAVIFSIFVAAVSQLNGPLNLNCLLYIGPGLLLVSGGLSGWALRGDTLSVGIALTQVDRHLEQNLSETEYLLWYFTEYYRNALQSVTAQTGRRARLVNLSVLIFLAGLLITAVGTVLRLGY